MMLLPISAIIATIAYLGSACLLTYPAQNHTTSYRHGGLLLGFIAVVSHGVTLFTRHHGHIDLHFFAAMSLVSGVIAALTLLVNLRRPVAGLGTILFPLAVIFLLLDVFLAPATTPTTLAWPISLHVAIALLAYSILSISAAVAILLALQEHALHHHRPIRWLHALPPLVHTETLLFRLIGIGFILLSLTLLSGALFVQNILAQHLAHIIAFSIIAWIIFGVLIWGRIRHGWRGTYAVNLTLIGMAMLVLGFFGSKFVLEILLHRGI